LLGNITLICKQLAKELASQMRYWFAIVNVARRQHQVDQFALVIENGMQFEAKNQPAEVLPRFASLAKSYGSEFLGFYRRLKKSNQ
jgi:hypothetical protein